MLAQLPPRTKSKSGSGDPKGGPGTAQRARAVPPPSIACWPVAAGGSVARRCQTGAAADQGRVAGRGAGAAAEDDHRRSSVVRRVAGPELSRRRSATWPGLTQALAQLRAAGFLPEVRVPDADTGRLRRLLASRNQVVPQRTRVKQRDPRHPGSAPRLALPARGAGRRGRTGQLAGWTSGGPSAATCASCGIGLAVLESRRSGACSRSRARTPRWQPAWRRSATAGASHAHGS